MEYVFQYTDVNSCPPSTENDALDPISVTIPANGEALSVLEASVNVDRAYRFTAIYFGPTLGYSIGAINGTSSRNPCFWFFYIQPPGSPNPVLSNLGLSSYLIPTSGYSVFMRYEKYSGEDEVCIRVFRSSFLLGEQSERPKSFLRTLINPRRRMRSEGYGIWLISYFVCLSVCLFCYHA